jgi:hypothetical protein
MLHVVSLAKYAAVYTRSWAADCPKARVRLRAERDQHQEDNALLREELRIKDARMVSISSEVFGRTVSSCAPPHFSQARLLKLVTQLG